MNQLHSHLNKYNEIISISGPSASGKTTLALQLTSNLIRQNKEEKCIWIQASESFPKRRLVSLLSGDLTRKKYLLQNTFVFPSDRVISSFEEQNELLSRISTQLYPPATKYFVIDNISHHLRLYLSLLKDFSQRSKAVNQFFDEILFPLIMRCKRELITFIMIHEVSQDPISGEIRPFYHNLFNRIESISFSFQGSIRFGTQILYFTSREKPSVQLSYELKDEGLFTCSL
jgi:predicted ATP-dependent serine protease